MAKYDLTGLRMTSDQISAGTLHSPNTTITNTSVGLGNVDSSSVSPSRPRDRKYSCTRHYIDYDVPDGYRRQCPMCALELRLSSTQQELKESVNQLALLKEQNTRLQQQVDVVNAIRSALDVIDDNDLNFLKEVLYQWKIDRSISLKVTHGPKKRGKRQLPPPNGFIAMPRGVDPWGHGCTSIGGMAIAGYYEEALNTVGSAKAMALMVRALSAYLPGAVE